MSWWDKACALFTPKGASEEEKKADRRVNSPYCACGKSTVDMEGDYASYERGPFAADDYMVVKCDSCGKVTKWFHTGFMGIRSPIEGFKEYQKRESYGK